MNERSSFFPPMNTSGRLNASVSTPSGRGVFALIIIATPTMPPSIICVGISICSSAKAAAAAPKHSTVYSTNVLRSLFSILLFTRSITPFAYKNTARP